MMVMDMLKKKMYGSSGIRPRMVVVAANTTGGRRINVAYRMAA